MLKVGEKPMEAADEVVETWKGEMKWWRKVECMP